MDARSMETVDMVVYLDGEKSLVASPTTTKEATQSKWEMAVPENGFEPEESLQLEDLWGSVLVENVQRTSCRVIEENVRETSERCKGNGKRKSRNRVEQRKAANRISYQSTDTLATAASTAPQESGASSSLKVSKLSSGSSIYLNISGTNATSVSSMNSGSQQFGISMDMNQSSSRFGEHDAEENEKRLDPPHRHLLTQPVRTSIPNIHVEEHYRKDSDQVFGGTSDSRSSIPAPRQRSFAVYDDDDDDLPLDSFHESLCDPIPVIALLQQISLQDRLWSSYSAIYDSDEEDYCSHPFANGYEHADMSSMGALGRMNASMIDFTTPDDFIIPYSDVDEDSSSSSPLSVSQSDSSMDNSNNEILAPVATVEMSAVLDKLDKQTFDPNPRSFETIPTLVKSTTHGLAKNAISTTAIYRLKRRIRSRRRRQIMLLRTANAHKNSVLEASQDQGKGSSIFVEVQHHEPPSDRMLEEKVEAKSQRVSISSLAHEFVPEFDTVVQISPTNECERENSSHRDASTKMTLPAKNQPEQSLNDMDFPADKDVNTLGRRNQSSKLRDCPGVDNGDNGREILGLPMPTGMDMPLVSTLGPPASGKNRSRDHKRSSSPVLYRLPRRLTPSPSREGRSSHKRRQKTSFGSYFPLSRSCPSSPNDDSVKPKVKTQRVQFMGLLKLPDSGLTPVDRWLSADEEKLQVMTGTLDTTQHSGLVSSVSSDKCALPPKRKKSIESLEQGHDVQSDCGVKDDQPSSSRMTSIGSDIAVAPPKRRNSFDDPENVDFLPISDDSATLRKKSTFKRLSNEICASKHLVVKPLREVDPLLEAALSKLSNVPIAKPDSVQSDRVLPKAIPKSKLLSQQRCGDNSSEKTFLESRIPSPAPTNSLAPPSRMHSEGSDQSSLDLAPYKPPIPDVSGDAEYYPSNSLPDDIDILSDYGSVSTHSESVWNAKSARRTEVKSMSPKQRVVPVVTKVMKLVTDNDTAKKLEKHLEAIRSTGKRFVSISISNSGSTTESRGRSGLPPSGRSATTIAGSSNTMASRGGSSITVKHQQRPSTNHQSSSRSQDSAGVASPLWKVHRSSHPKSPLSRGEMDRRKSSPPTDVPGSSNDAKLRNVLLCQDAISEHHHQSVRSSSLPRSARLYSLNKSSKLPSRFPDVSSSRRSEITSNSPSGSSKGSQSDSQKEERTTRNAGKSKKRSTSMSRSDVADSLSWREEARKDFEHSTPPPAQKGKLTPQMLKKKIKDLPLDF